MTQAYNTEKLAFEFQLCKNVNEIRIQQQLRCRVKTSCEQIYQKGYFEGEFALDSEGFPLMKGCV